MKRNRFLLLGVASSTLLFAPSAFAYVDPGTGTLLIQWLFGMAVAAFAVINVYWERAKGFLASKFGSSTPAAEGTEAAAEDAGSEG